MALCIAAIVLWVALFADYAPVLIEGHTLTFVLDEATGEFAQYKDHHFKTDYLKDNAYKDVDLTTGLLNDEGNYHYFKTGENSAEVHYKVTDEESPWKNRHIIESWEFTSPTTGTVSGVHAGDFSCGYKGTFAIMANDEKKKNSFKSQGHVHPCSRFAGGPKLLQVDNLLHSAARPETCRLLSSLFSCYYWKSDLCQK